MVEPGQGLQNYEYLYQVKLLGSLLNSENKGGDGKIGKRVQKYKYNSNKLPMVMRRVNRVIVVVSLNNRP